MCTEAGHEVVCHESAYRHGAHAGDVAQLHQFVRRPYHLLEIQAAPVVHAAFAHHGAEGHAAQQQHVAVQPLTQGDMFLFHRFFLCLCGFPVMAHQQAAHIGGQGDGQDRHQQEVRPRLYLQGDETHADDATQESAQAPQPVERSHDAAGVEVLHVDTLCVGGDVEQVAAHAEQEQSGGQEPDIAGCAQRKQHQRIEQRGQGQHPPAAETVDEPGREIHGRHLPHGDGEQDRAQLGVTQLQGAFDVGDAVGPSGENGSLHKEKQADSQPEATERLCSCKHTATCFCVLVVQRSGLLG